MVIARMKPNFRQTSFAEVFATRFAGVRLDASRGEKESIVLRGQIYVYSVYLLLKQNKFLRRWKQLNGIY